MEMQGFRWSVEPDDPRRLALVRAGLFSYIALALGTPWLGPESVWQLRHWAEVPQDLMIPPSRYNWIAEATWDVFPTPVVVVVAVAMLGSAVAAAAGWKPRLTGAVVAIAGAYVWLLPQLFGKVNHNHHLVLLALIVAFTPCAEVWSVRKEPRRPRLHHQVGNYGVWIVLALVYLFPGVAKMVTRGWTSADSMERMILAQRAIGQAGDAVPLELLPLALLGPATLVFEVGFLPAVLLSRWTRMAWAVMGVTFHMMTTVLLGISFLSLLPAYVALMPLRVQRHAHPARGDPTGVMPTGAGVLVVAFVVSGMFAAGIQGRQHDWPFAAYPFVNRIPGDTVVVSVIHIDGSPVMPNERHPWMSWQRAQFYLERSVMAGREDAVRFITGVDAERVEVLQDRRPLTAFR